MQIWTNFLTQTTQWTFDFFNVSSCTKGEEIIMDNFISFSKPT